MLIQALLDAIAFLFGNLQWVLGGIGTLLIPLIAVVGSPVRILSLTISSGMNYVMKAATAKGIRQAIDYRLLPVDQKASTVTSYMANAANRAVRMREYQRTLREQRALQDGPYALQQLIEDMYDSPFHAWRRRLKLAIRKFDQHEEKVHSLIYDMEDRKNRVKELYNSQLECLQMELIHLRIVWSRSIQRLATQRKLRGLRLSILSVRRRRQNWKARNKAFLKLKKKRDYQLEKIMDEANIRLRPYLSWLHDFEMENLGLRVHDFQAAWASCVQTVESGRTLRRLMDAKDPQAAHIRQCMKLEDLPYEVELFRSYICDQLRGRVGLHPQSSLEDVFETWLRVYYSDLGPSACPELAPLGSRGFYLWVTNLVPPGAKGLANETYMHQPHLATNMMGWIEPLHKED